MTKDDLTKLKLLNIKQKDKKSVVYFTCILCKKDVSIQLRSVLLKDELICQKCLCKSTIISKYGKEGLKNKLIRDRIEKTTISHIGVRSALCIKSNRCNG